MNSTDVFYDAHTPASVHNFEMGAECRRVHGLEAWCRTPWRMPVFECFDRVVDNASAVASRRGVDHWCHLGGR